MSTQLDVRSERRGTVDVVALTGEIDHESAVAVERRLLGLAEQARALVLDITEVTFIDSAGVRLLDRLVETCADRALLVASPDDGPVRLVLRLCAFPEHLLRPTADGAAAELGG